MSKTYRCFAEKIENYRVAFAASQKADGHECGDSEIKGVAPFLDIQQGADDPAMKGANLAQDRPGVIAQS
ncbi:hypothetical protein [Novosphingobium sediminicola]|uniref:Uncharacterized protein n=1 Tax=Novosphingobium sediminicola TaxID=563162 RepID=A0A7W6CI59_9SPHN|nr:hypothetical protein [Novosphingobium sediminicola]MBB3954818.1 hypothetical protein [Novosphingobium sediminicola]